MSFFKEPVSHVATVTAAILGYLAIVDMVVTSANESRHHWEEMTLESLNASNPAATSLATAAAKQAQVDFHNWYGSIFVMNTIIGGLVIAVVVVTSLKFAAAKNRPKIRPTLSGVLDLVWAACFLGVVWSSQDFCLATYRNECTTVLGTPPVYGGIPTITLKP